MARSVEQVGGSAFPSRRRSAKQTPFKRWFQAGVANDSIAPLPANTIHAKTSLDDMVVLAGAGEEKANRYLPKGKNPYTAQQKKFTMDPNGQYFFEFLLPNSKEKGDILNEQI